MMSQVCVGGGGGGGGGVIGYDQPASNPREPQESLLAGYAIIEM